MKIIFLDVDGVLNHEIFYTKRMEEGIDKYPTYPLSEIDPKSIEVINYIIEKTEAKVVISSVWRHGRTIQELQNIFNQLGFKGDIIDKTPDLRSDECLRGNEILKWIKTNEKLVGKQYHEYENYVILDDDSDMLYWQRNNFIHVDRWVGVTINDAAIAIRILNQGTGTLLF